MAITLSVGATVVTLPVDLHWQDEFTYSPVQQAVETSITGALVIDVATRIGGRPITLVRDPDGKDTGWTTRATLEQINTWASVAGQQMVLTLRGATRTVVFAHHGGNAVTATPVAMYTDTDYLGGAGAADYYRIELRLMEI